MKYKSVIITHKGAPDVLKVVDNDLREPVAGEARIKVLATGVGRTDIVMRRGYYPYAPRIPFAPGYEIVGVVDALGACVDRPDRSLRRNDGVHGNGTHHGLGWID